MPDFLTIRASLACLTWFWLLMSHHDFWRSDQRLPSVFADLAKWPSVVAVVPARNAADVITTTVASLDTQDYPGVFQIILVDDQSEDDTSNAARTRASDDRVEIIQAPPLRSGWTGKLAAMNHGVEQAYNHFPDHVYILFTDADIAHPPDTVRRRSRRQPFRS